MQGEERALTPSFLTLPLARRRRSSRSGARRPCLKPGPCRVRFSTAPISPASRLTRRASFRSSTSARNACWAYAAADVMNKITGGGIGQNPCEGTSSALLNLLERFWKAMRPVSSTMASSSKNCLRFAISSSLTCRSVKVIASAYSRATRSRWSKTLLLGQVPSAATFLTVLALLLPEKRSHVPRILDQRLFSDSHRRIRRRSIRPGVGLPGFRTHLLSS